ncbi:hypothetical protein KKI17_03035, partial [Patescibacteria group bacterium]|nr:hypothetical protein [Patescibacteria group bacterium]
DAMAGYFSGLYVFDNTQGEIYRYATLDSQPQAWTAEDSRKPAEGTASAVIDGNIWTATEQGETMRFWKGKYEETFAFPAYPKNAKIVRLLTQVDTPLLFLIDTKEGRVVVMNKNGELTSQYRSRQLLDAALSPDAKTLFLLQEGNIVTIKIP